jgi:O-antigen ligase
LDRGSSACRREILINPYKLRLQIPLGHPLILFLASAFFGALIGYSPAQSAYVLSLIVGSVALYCFIVLLEGAGAPLLWLVLLFLAVSAALVSHFAIQHDWVNSPHSIPLINRIGVRLNHWFPKLPIPALHPNNLAGILELALPLALALATHWLSERQHRKAIAVLGVALVLFVGMALSDSRGAWLGFAAAVALVLFARGAWWLRHTPQSWRYLVPLAIILVLIACIALVGPPAFAKPLAALTGRMGESANEIPRPVLYQQVAGLIRDYIFTGSGLGTFPMVYATYALLQNVFILPHAHNIFLQIWIEQGLLGITAFLWFILGFYAYVWRQRSRLEWLAFGGLIATTVMLVHGLVDAALWYSDLTRVLLFTPMALTLAGLEFDARSNRPWIALAAGTSGVIILVLTWSPLSALWNANLGSLAQTRVELGQYKFPEQLVEYTRRDADLTLAEDFFRRALSLDDGNVTANQRLAMIALARGDYRGALGLAQTAYKRDANDPVTWQLLGDAYLGLGDPEQAYTYWSRIDGAPGRLREEAIVRYAPQRDWARAKWAEGLAERIQASR